jgi:hypothetical protein
MTVETRSRIQESENLTPKEIGRTGDLLMVEEEIGEDHDQVGPAQVRIHHLNPQNPDRDQIQEEFGIELEEGDLVVQIVQSKKAALRLICVF